jgi:hypothetical protein
MFSDAAPATGLFVDSHRACRHFDREAGKQSSPDVPLIEKEALGSQPQLRSPIGRCLPAQRMLTASMTKEEF